MKDNREPQELECHSCKELKKCTYTHDPYLADVYAEDAYAWWCEDCVLKIGVMISNEDC